jgi:hypothetical protein
MFFNRFSKRLTSEKRQYIEHRRTSIKGLHTEEELPDIILTNIHDDLIERALGFVRNVLFPLAWKVRWVVVAFGSFLLAPLESITFLWAAGVFGLAAIVICLEIYLD